MNTIAQHVIRSSEGGWTVPGHADFGFLAEDPMSWENIEDRSFWYRHRNRVILEVIRQWRPDGRLFEIGAGNGFVSLALQQADVDVVAIEPTVAWAKVAVRRGVKTVICATFEACGFQPGTVLNVGLFDVLEHIENDAEFLQNLYDHMPAGGKLYCAVPAYQWMWSTEDVAASHCRRYSIPQLKQLLSRVGFETLYATYYFQMLVVPVFFLRSLPSLLGVRKRRSAAATQTEHFLAQHRLGWVLNILLDREIRLIAKSRSLPFGASCLCVCRK